MFLSKKIRKRELISSTFNSLKKILNFFRFLYTIYYLFVKKRKRIISF